MIDAIEILDSRGNPTIEVCVELSSGSTGIASVPSGASTGNREAFELRDADQNRFCGKGVKKAVNNVKNIIFKNVRSIEFESQQDFDQALVDLDGTNNKSNLGANAILGVSLAFAKAVAKEKGMHFFEYIRSICGLENLTTYRLPVPMVNILNGGVHADNGLCIQEFMVTPSGYDFHNGLQKVVEIFHNLKKFLKNNNYVTNVGDEGGFAPDFKSAEEALDALVYVINGDNNIEISLDVAASELYDDGKYSVEYKNNDTASILNSLQMSNYLLDLTSKYPILSIEDPMSEDDIEGWKFVTNMIASENKLIVGDDIFATNSLLLQKLGIEKKFGNAIIIKPNQVGTLTETLQTILLAKTNGYKTIVSHRSGETEDTSIAHIAVAVNSEYIKTGSVCRTDRTAKYNELLRIARILNNK